MENIIPFEQRRNVPDFLDSFTLDVLADVLGFGNGAFPLHRAGYVTLRKIYRAHPDEIKKVPFIGKVKYAALVKFFSSHGYEYPMDDPERPKVVSLEKLREGRRLLMRPRA